MNEVLTNTVIRVQFNESEKLISTMHNCFHNLRKNILYFSFTKFTKHFQTQVLLLFSIAGPFSKDKKTEYKG